MDYIKEIEHQIDVMRAYNDKVYDSGIATSIAMMAEKAFYMSERANEKGRKFDNTCLAANKRG